MKVTVTQYAKTLYALTAGKTEREVDGVVANFIKVLEKNRQQKLAKKIMAKFSEVWNQEEGIVEAEVATSSDMGQATRDKVEKFIVEKYAAKKVVLNNVIDEKIKGGIIIKIGDEIMDGSIACQLKNLKNNLSK